MATQTVVSLGRGSGMGAYSATTNILTTTPADVFDVNIPAGTSSLHIERLDGPGGAVVGRAVIVFTDIGTSAAPVAQTVDHSGLSYCSLNRFDATVPLRFALKDMAGGAESLELRRSATRLTIASSTIDSSGAAVVGTNNLGLGWHFTVHVQSTDSSLMQAAVSQNTVYRLVEPYDSLLLWDAKTDTARMLSEISSGTGDAGALAFPDDVFLGSGGEFTLAPGRYQFDWSVPAFGVDKFQSWLHTSAAAVNQSGTDYMGSQSYSSNSSASTLAYSIGSATLAFTASVTCSLRAVCESKNLVSGRGNLSLATTDIITNAPANSLTDAPLSTLTIQVLA